MSGKQMSKKPTSYQKIYFNYSLNKSWNYIYAKGIKSDCSEIRNKMREFQTNSAKEIRKIYRELSAKKYKFGASKGVLQGKKKRPIVISNIRDKIVQRSILNVLQEDRNVKLFYNNDSSFGAIKNQQDGNKGVESAIRKLVDEINNGCNYYYKSDIKNFFTSICRDTVFKTIKLCIDDQDFMSILEDATNVEISNLNSIPSQHKKFFNYDKNGTPQGCCLSPLLGNILLHKFDKNMNSIDIKCFRYLDDFIILGHDEASVKGAFKKASKILGQIDLTTYDCYHPSKKGCFGLSKNGISFLGVDVKNNIVKPSNNSKNRLLKSIDTIIDESIRYFIDQKGDFKDNSLTATLMKINNKLKGWGNQYSFCNDKSLWGSIDDEVNKKISRLLGSYRKSYSSKDKTNQRRLLGVHLIVDSKSNPIDL